MSDVGGRPFFRRVERFGFPALFLGAFLVAIGIRQGIQELWVVGLMILGVVFLYAIVRAVRGAWGRPRRPPAAEPITKPKPPSAPIPGVTRSDDV